MSLLPVLPILIPLATVIGCLLNWRNVRAQRGLSLIGALLLAVVSVLLLAETAAGRMFVVEVGNWAAPFGITLVIDRFSALMLLLTGLLAPAIVVYSIVGIDDAREAHGFHPLLHAMLLGVCGAFCTGDLFNMYVWFEVMLIASFVLVALGGERAQLEGATKYVALNLLSSTMFLAGVGILYASVGTLNLADLARLIALAAESELPAERMSMATVAGALLLVAFGIKAAVFPLFFWLPASYHTPPVAIGAVLAGLLTKVGVYSLVRVSTLLFPHEFPLAQPVLAWCAALTMITGVLGAAAQHDIRRILAFHSISQVGYMLMGLAIHTPLAIAGTLVFLLHHGLVKANLFLIAGVVQRLGGSFHLGRIGGFYVSHPGVSILFFVVAMSLAGIPPLSGFWAKLPLVVAGLQTGHWWLVGAALGVSLLTLYSMTKIWAEAFWKDVPQTDGASATVPAVSLSRRQWAALVVPCVVLAGLMLALGLFADPLFAYTEAAARELLDPERYIRAVLAPDTLIEGA